MAEARTATHRGVCALISGATGAEPATTEERAWLKTLSDLPVRATGSNLGHGFEPQFAMNIALATLALGRGSCSRHSIPPALSSTMTMRSIQVVVTGVGHWRGEGMALVEAVK